MRRETFLQPAEMIPVGASKGFNLSRWAIDHGGFTAFLLVLLLTAGAFSFLRIGQKEASVSRQRGRRPRGSR